MVRFFCLYCSVDSSSSKTKERRGKTQEKRRRKKSTTPTAQATGQGPKCPKCPGSPSTLRGCGRLKVTVSQSHGVQPHKQGHQGLDENKDERVKGTKTACHFGRRVTAQPGSRRTASLPPRPPPQKRPPKKRGCSTSLFLKSTTNVTCKKRRVTARKSMRENRAKTKFSENAKTQKRLFFRKNACSERAGAAARAQLHLQVADVKESRTKPHCLPMIQTCRASTLALHSQPAKVSGLWILLPSASQKRTFRESSLHFRNVAPCRDSLRQLCHLSCTSDPHRFVSSSTHRFSKSSQAAHASESLSVAKQTFCQGLGPYRSCWAPRQCWSTGTATRCASP